MKRVLEEPIIIHDLIEKYLTPFVRQIDEEAFYAETFLRKIGESHLFLDVATPVNERLQHEMYLVEETAKTCMTTAFCLWCHLAALTYIRNTKNEVLRSEVLHQLETGALIAGTGLSNPLKYFAGLETIQLQAKETTGGYVLTGSLPYISNLRPHHSVAVIAKQDNGEKIMCFIPCDTKGFQMRERTDYLGLNGSATHVCILKDVYVPDDHVISREVEAFVDRVRAEFIAYQIPLGLGVTTSAIATIERVKDKQNGCNAYLPVQANDLHVKKTSLEERLQAATTKEVLDWEEIAQIRLDTVYLTLEAVQAAMLHNGSAGYLRASVPSRKLREAYFFANLTPTVKHLEKVL